MDFPSHHEMHLPPISLLILLTLLYILTKSCLHFLFISKYITNIHPCFTHTYIVTKSLNCSKTLFPFFQTAFTANWICKSTNNKSSSRCSRKLIQIVHRLAKKLCHDLLTAQFTIFMLFKHWKVESQNNTEDCESKKRLQHLSSTS